MSIKTALIIESLNWFGAFTDLFHVVRGGMDKRLLASAAFATWLQREKKESTRRNFYAGAAPGQQTNQSAARAHYYNGAPNLH